jgi:hypothetical protein
MAATKFQAFGEPSVRHQEIAGLTDQRSCCTARFERFARGRIRALADSLRCNPGDDAECAPSCLGGAEGSGYVADRS